MQVASIPHKMRAAETQRSTMDEQLENTTAFIFEAASVEPETDISRRSGQVASDECLAITTTTICCLLSQVLPHITTPSPSPSKAGTMIPALSEAGTQLQQRIVNFFLFARQYTRMTTGEMLYTIYLIDRLIQSELQPYSTAHDQTLITEATLGTLLLVCALLAEKQSRDRPFSNGWWGKIFGLPVQLLNESEIVILKRLGFRMEMKPEQYEALFKNLLGEEKMGGEEKDPIEGTEKTMMTKPGTDAREEAGKESIKKEDSERQGKKEGKEKGRKKSPRSQLRRESTPITSLP